MPSSVEYYLSKGFDEKTARYFAEGRRFAVSVRALPKKLIAVTFDNGEIRSFDATPLIKDGTVFAFLKDEDAFSRVYVDENHSIAWDKDPNVDSNVEWSNKVDISSDTCYLDGIPMAS